MCGIQMVQLTSDFDKLQKTNTTSLRFCNNNNSNSNKLGVDTEGC